MMHRPRGMGMGVNTGSGPEEEWMVWRTDAAKVRAVREAVDRALKSLREERGFA